MPKIFGLEHSIYVAISLVLATIVCLCAKFFIKTDKAKSIFMRCAGAVLFAVIFANRLALVFEREEPNWLKLITDSFCSTSSYVLALTLIFGKKDNNILHFIWLIALGGGVITTFMPNFIGQHPSFLYPPTILGLMHHTISAIIVIVMIQFRYINITYKKWYCTLCGFLCYFGYGAFLLTFFKFGNPFYMTGPAIDGTPLTAWVIAPIYIAIYALILFIIEIVRKKRAKKLKVAQNNENE